MSKIKFIGKTPIRATTNGVDVVLIPGEYYENKIPAESDYIKSLVAQGFFEEVLEESIEVSEEVNTPTDDLLDSNEKPKSKRQTTKPTP